MTRIIDGIYRTLQVLITLLMALLIIPVTLQILSRFTELLSHYIWTEEAARFCFIWIVMIGSMIAVRDDAHFDIELLPKPSTPRGMAVSRAIRHSLILLVALTFVWFGYDFALFGFNQQSELTGINMAWIHAAWPLAGLVYTLFLGERLYQDLQLFRRGADE